MSAGLQMVVGQSKACPFLFFVFIQIRITKKKLTFKLNLTRNNERCAASGHCQEKGRLESARHGQSEHAYYIVVLQNARHNERRRHEYASLFFFEYQSQNEKESFRNMILKLGIY